MTPLRDAGAGKAPTNSQDSPATEPDHESDHEPDHEPEHEPAEAEPALVPLDEPADGVPDVVTDERRLVAVADALARGSGPVALDAERASGYRYGQRAYLVQIRRAGSGTFLIDPIACPDLGPVAEVIGPQEWILHAATQDLPCLAEVGLTPTRLFDTELGSRLVGLPRVGLAAVVAHYLGLSLAKEHSAVDWSTRPLPEPWLRYAALDVEVLVEVRDRIAADLEAQGKTEWATQEFEALTHFTGPRVRLDPWRRTSGMHRIRNRRGAALVRELWQTREAIAQERDTAPGRVLPDALIIDLATRAPRAAADLATGRVHKGVRRYQRQWLDAIHRALRLPEQDLPPLTIKSDAPPPARSWADREPVAAARLAESRELLGKFADEHHVPVENLLTPDLLRRVLWTPPAEPTPEAVRAALDQLGARPWQVDIAAPVICAACEHHPS
jgi:ribonuclease D